MHMTGQAPAAIAKPIDTAAVIAWCCDVGCCFDLSGVSHAQALLRATVFIAAELQSARAAAAHTLKHSAGTAHSSSVAHKAPILLATQTNAPAAAGPNELLRIGQQLCTLLRVPPPSLRRGGEDAAAEAALARALLAVHGRVNALLPLFGGDGVPRSTPLLPPSLRTEGVQAILTQVNAMLRSDYAARRAMLVKRLSVTMQSLLWGEGAVASGSDGGSLAAETSARLSGLSGEPPLVSLEDVFEAGPELLHLAGLRVTSTPPHSAVKGVVIGAVPDRGGRAGEMRPSASEHMPAWMSKRAAGSGRGGGTGGRGRGARGGSSGGSDSGGRGGKGTVQSGGGRGGRGGGGRKKRGRDKTT